MEAGPCMGGDWLWGGCNIEGKSIGHVAAVKLQTVIEV